MFMNKLWFRNLIFDIFANARILFNDYYNGKEDYTDEDIERIMELLEKVKEDIKQIESEME